jgi:hypothetical protein
MVIYIPPIVLWLSAIPIIFLVWFIAFFILGLVINCGWFGRLCGDSWKVRQFVEAAVIAFLILLPAFTATLLGLAYHKLGLF